MKKEEFNPAVLPMEFRPHFPNGAGDRHKRYYLIPGTIFVATEPLAVSTIVGSGVSLCLWDSVKCIGGANHFMLPEGPEDGQDARYGNVANPSLLQRLLKLGADVKALEAKIIGGSQPKLTFGNEKEDLGTRNVLAVIGFLKLQQIRLVQKDVGGTRGRKLVFQTDSGQVWAEPL